MHVVFPYIDKTKRQARTCIELIHVFRLKKKKEKSKHLYSTREYHKNMKKSTQDNISNAYNTSPDGSIALRTDVNLCEDDISEEAKEQFSNHTEILRVNQFTANSILSNERLTHIGRHLFCVTLEKNYTDYKNVLNYVAAHPELKIATQSIRAPLILCGLPRTGTTLLFNLLACDSACRAPLMAEMLEPVPPLARSDDSRQMQRNKILNAREDMFNVLGLTDYQREICASHPSYAVDEDLYILAHTTLRTLHYLLAPHKDHEFATWWLNDVNKDFAYEYHKTFLQMLNSVDAPRSHWLLKTPVHTIYLETLLRYYPTASLIMVHRRLDETLPSSVRMALSYTSAFYENDTNDVKSNRKTVVELMLQFMDVSIQRLLQFRRTNQNISVIDILYDDLVVQPIETVRRIYKYFELAWSDDFELAMLAWFRDNPQGVQGRNTYTLTEFGLECEMIDKCYEEYNTMFFKTRD